jgi:hypothetical protein
MPTYRKKDEFVQAVQWHPGASIPDVHEATLLPGGGAAAEPVGIFRPGDFEHWVRPGDWIVTADEGDESVTYVLKDSTFTATFEPA